jgi:hypothetical protein
MTYPLLEKKQLVQGIGGRSYCNAYAIPGFGSYWQVNLFACKPANLQKPAVSLLCGLGASLRSIES